MKFTDGQWLIRSGVTAHYAAEAHDLSVQDNTLVVHAPTRPIRHRGDTLQGPLLTVSIDSPLEGVVRVKIQHFIGGATNGPVIPLTTEGNIPVQIENGADGATLRSGD
jgi:alpha-D-xyloside xylohydrolase